MSVIDNQARGMANEAKTQSNIILQQLSGGLNASNFDSNFINSIGNAIPANDTVTVDKLDSQTRAMICESSTTYNYTTVVSGANIAGTYMVFLRTNFPADKKLRITINALKSGTVNFKLYNYNAGTFTKYHDQVANLVTGQNVVELTVITTANTRLAIDTLTSGLIQYDNAPNPVVGFDYKTHASYSNDSTLTAISSFNNYNFPLKVEEIIDVYKYAKNLNTIVSDNTAKISKLFGFGNNTFIVGKDATRFTYTTIQSAVDAAVSGDTIIIFPGTYTESVESIGKDIHFKGINKKTCIVYDSSANKTTPPFDIAGGSISDLTIIEDHSNPTTSDPLILYKAYCIHIDSPSAIGKKIRIENCILRNSYFPCFGMGLWQDCTIEIINCDVDTYDINPIVDNRGYGALYYHSNSSSNITNQNISIVNCRVYSAETMVLRNTNVVDGSVVINEYINNMFFSRVSGITGIINQTTFDAVKNIKLGSSYGNNVVILNS
jgi:hypothetical protein